jgi:hypothetical protein
MDDVKAHALRDKAKTYRALARASTDDETADRMFGLAAELERQARGTVQDE